MGGIYEASQWDGLPKLHKDWFKCSKVDSGGDSQTCRQHGDLTCLLLFFHIRNVGWNRNFKDKRYSFWRENPKKMGSSKIQFLSALSSWEKHWDYNDTESTISVHFQQSWWMKSVASGLWCDIFAFVFISKITHLYVWTVTSSVLQFYMLWIPKACYFSVGMNFLAWSVFKNYCLEITKLPV
jgi:hypothetical protein